MSLTLYTYPGNFRAWKAQIAALYNGIVLNTSDISDLKEAAYSKPPVLSTPQGQLFESNAIASYIAGLNPATGLSGGSYFQQAQVRQWVDFAAFDIEPQRAVWLLPIRKVIAFNAKAYAAAKDDLQASLAVLNAYLANNTFLVGNSVTLADITVACALVELMQEVLDNGFRAAIPNVQRWFLTCVNQKEFNQVLGKVSLASKEAKAPQPQAQKQDSKKQDAKKSSGKKEAAPADDADAEVEKPAEKKPKNPLDLLPPSSMSLDATKKLMYAAKGPSQLNFTNPAFWSGPESFWPTFDPQGYSFWIGLYDYNAENKEFWKVQNGVSFFIQRMDQVRKYGMAVINVLGASISDPDDQTYFEINGCWMFRGTEIPFEMKDVPDTDYYKFTRVDATTPAGQALIRSYYCDDKLPTNPKDGKKGPWPVIERKYFK